MKGFKCVMTFINDPLHCLALFSSDRQVTASFGLKLFPFETYLAFKRLNEIMRLLDE